MTRPRRAAANSASEAIKTPEVKKEAKSPKKKVTKKKEEVAPEAKPEAAKEENPSSGPPKTKAEMKENGEAAPAAPSPSGEASEASASDPKAEPAAPAAKAKKPVKKTVPAWATLSKSQQELLSKKKSGVSSTTLGGPSARQILVEAVQATRNARGHASAVAVRKYVKKRCPHWPKVTLKTALRKAVEAKAIVQVKGSFKLGPKAAEKKAEPKKKPAKKVSKSRQVLGAPTEPLDNLLPNIFTWVCEPKEASFGLIRKYIAQHHKNLDVEGKMFLKAIEKGCERGQLERLTGKGGSGTFQLVDGAKKSGTKYEDAIEDAIIAMNEPKDASVQALRHYLSEYHLEYRVSDRPKVLRSALERCEARGWIKRISGKGFSGSFRLAFPYYPNPRDLWGEWYEEEDDDDEKPKKKRRKAAAEESSEEEGDSSEEEEEDSEEEESEDDEPVYVPKNKRGPPKARKPLPPPKRKSAPKGRARR